MTALDAVAALVEIAFALSLIMTVAWLIQQRTGNSGWVDTVWTFGVGLTGAVVALKAVGNDDWQHRQILVACFAVIWAMRLGAHIASRTTKIPNDPRYAEKIKAWGSDAPRQMFWFLQIQALVGIPLVMSMFLAAHNPAPGWTVQDGLAILVMAVAVFGEGLADAQLRAFKADPANKGGIIESGLWRWSRHPNYFFEALGWLAYPLLAIDLSGHYYWGFAALAAPVCMYWLLVYVSGIPPLEEHMLRTRPDTFPAYRRRVNAFFPGPQKEEP